MTRFNLCAIFIACVCCSDNHTDTRKIEALLRHYKQQIAYSAYLIVPMEGCSGCRERTLEFMKSYYKDVDVCFIISHSPHNSKVLKLSLPEDLLNSDNVLISSIVQLQKHGLEVSEFPLLFERSNGVIERKKVLSAANIDDDLAAIRANYGN